MKKCYFSIFLFILFGSIVYGQNVGDVVIDENGVMRWPDNKEVYGFGVNYTVPFAHAYRAGVKLGVNHREAIDNDVYHMTRLGFDAFRVHVWDTEISDSVGNLLENEHLDLFDYMLAEMQARGIKILLTPIAFWGNGWPEPDEPTPGFSHKYGKDGCLVIEEAIQAQERYLGQFVNHVNPYTGLAYKNDPNIIAFEVSNEPHHRQPGPEVTSYVARMINSMKKNGLNKPILYNISHGIHLVDDYFAAGIDGGTFQWYPTGLGAQEELSGNFLPNVDKYDIPFKDNTRFKKGAKIVYEFDAADIGRSYIYPAIARSFRSAGIQWATHFSYDPTYLAYANTEYNTHYMNLAYAPQKALSLKIASEVFHQIPMYTDYGNYPLNTKFGDFEVNYQNDLALYNSNTKYFYTNSTLTPPAKEKDLKEIAGFGNSPIVKYEGLGAYFIDKLSSGVWRLEVMPDALWIKNLFGRNSLDKEVALINWHKWSMSLDLDDLGEDFSILPLNSETKFSPTVNHGKFSIEPGVYILRSKKSKNKAYPERYNNIKVDEYSAPQPTLKKTIVIHAPKKDIAVGNPLSITTAVYSDQEIVSVELWVSAGRRSKVYKMENSAAYEYSYTIDEKDIAPGFLRYYIIVEEKDKFRTFPADLEGKPYEWDFYERTPYEVKVHNVGAPIQLFSATTDFNELNMKWNPGVTINPTDDPDKLELYVNIKQLFTEDAENPKAEPVHDYSLRYSFKDKIRARTSDLTKADKLILKGRALNNKECPVQISLVAKNGVTYGSTIILTPENTDYQISISDLKPTRLVTLPRPYPTFLPYYFEPAANAEFDISQVEALQLSIGPGLKEAQLSEKNGIALESIRLELY